jgi:hypothetical protein
VAAFSSNQISTSFSRYWPWFFITAAFESLIAIVALLLVPSESGLSLPRLALLGILFLLASIGVFLGIRARKDPARFDAFARTSFIFSATLLSLLSGLILFLLRYLNPEKLLPYYERVSPLLWVALIISLQAILFLNLVKNGFHFENLPGHKPVYRAAFIVFCSLLSVFLFVAITKIGIKPDTAYWGEPGVAIQGWQFIVSILMGMLVATYVAGSSRSVNIFIPFLLYITACALWMSVSNDVLSSSFYAPIDPPLDIPLPYSDAGFYDYLSQSLLIGTDYFGRIPPRPFYVLFLAVLHYFFGQNYAAMITAQSMVLALFPISLYFLAKRLHSPAAGVTIALFAIFRELTSLWISSNTRVVNSRMFTTDFPTAMAIAFTCLIFLWWLERRDLRSTLIAGGAFGLLLLFRTQSLFILPFVFLLAWFVYQRRTKTWILAGLVFAGMMIITVFPWLAHNHQLTGKFTFDDPNQMAIVYSQYSFNETFDLNEFDIQSQSLGSRMLEFTLQNPAYVATFVATHILNTEIGGLLALPLIQPFESLIAPINLYWVGWDGSIEWYNLLLLIIYLAIIAVGLGVAWRRMGWLGLLPLAFNLGYAFANGISRFSSWRYNLPVDWVIYFYFGIGILEVFFLITSLFGRKTLESNSPVPHSGMLFDKREFTLRDFRPQYLLILAGFALVGSLPWVAQGYAQPRYTSTQEKLIHRLSSDRYTENELKSFLEQPDAILLEGRILYPRMYQRDEGMASANPWAAYAIRDFPRMGFLVINDRMSDVIFRTREVPDFPQGQDVILLGCQRADHIEAYLVDFSGQVFESLPLTQACH